MQLTIITERGRHDKDKLLDGYAGSYFWSILSPISRDTCRIIQFDPLTTTLPLEGVCLLLGEKCCETLLKDRGSFNAIRGSTFCFHDNKLIVVASYLPQDAMDRKDYEGEEDSENEISTEKDHQRTKRRNWRQWLYFDVQKVKRLLKTGLLAKENMEVKIAPSLEILPKNVKDKYVYFDIETDRLHNLTCIGIAVDNCTYVFPFKTHLGELFYGERSSYEILRYIAVLFRDNTIVIHNALFDLMVMAYRFHIPPPKKIVDTMLWWHRLEPELEQSLGHLVALLTDEPYHKNEGVFKPQNHSQDLQLWNYNAKDVYTLKLVHLALQNRTSIIQERSVRHAMQCIRPYMTMMLHGIRCDLAKREELDNKYSKLAFQFERCLGFIVGKDLNPRSPQQVSNYLYNVLKLKKPDEDPTNVKNLLAAYNKSHAPSIRLILASRGNSKRASALNFPLWKKDRVTTAYKISGTDTLRLASRTLFRFTKEHIDGYGCNLQNWNKSNRICLIPDEGKVFLQADQSGAEALLVAYLCIDGRLRQLFLNGIKPHIYVSLHRFFPHWSSLVEQDLTAYLTASPHELKAFPLWKKLNALIKADLLKYATAKMICHASNYDMKAKTFQQQAMVKSDNQLVLTLKECESALTLYHQLFPELSQWHDETRAIVCRERKLKNLFGFERNFHGLFGDDLFRQAYAYVPQSTVGCITHNAIIDLQKGIEDKKYPALDLLQNGHDSILAQCRKEDAKDFASVLKASLEQELVSPRGEHFQMKAEVSMGENWYDMEEIVV